MTAQLFDIICQMNSPLKILYSSFDDIVITKHKNFIYEIIAKSLFLYLNITRLIYCLDMSGFILYSMHMLSYMGKRNCNIFHANNKSINVNPIISNKKINWKQEEQRNKNIYSAKVPPLEMYRYCCVLHSLSRDNNRSFYFY